MKTKPKLGYTLRRTAPSQWERFETLTLDIITPEGYDQLTKASMHWQTHERGGHCEGPAEWYGHRFDLTATVRHIEDIEYAAVLLKRVKKKLQTLQGKDYPSWEPKEVATACEELGWQRYVYDKRRSRYVMLSDVMPPEYRSWMVGYRAMGFDSNPFSWVMARDEDEARREMAKVMMNGDGWRSAEVRLVDAAAWQSAGRPMECLRDDSMYGPPDMKQQETIMMSRKEEADAAAAALQEEALTAR